jgi:glycosyltransferase involved in cell wall biosynthesis
MAQGVPVIATPHTAAPDIITDGVDGFIVPIRDASAIAARLVDLYHDRERLLAMGMAARAKASTFTWASYENALARVVASALSARRKVRPK